MPGTNQRADRTIGVCLIALLWTLPPFVCGAELDTEIVASGLTWPVYVTAPPGDTSRLFIVEKRGVIKILQIPSNTLLSTPFIDLNSLVVDPSSSFDERGLLGLAFHPNYSSNGFFYVYYIDNSGFPGDTVIARYHVSGNPDVADAGSAVMLKTYNQPESNHNGGCLQFGPDDMLYVSAGDGGGAGDQHGSFGNGQSLDVFLGKLLRLDVDAGSPYVPNDNPFVGQSGLDEIWQYGLRNPWRFSFDRANGDLYIGDVGQNTWEELDYVSSSSNGGENFGWRCMEGNACFVSPSGPECTCGGGNLTDPVHVYSISGQPTCSIIGGYVYRGSAIPDEVGNYFFGDHCSGETWSLRIVGGSVTSLTERTSELGVLSNLSSFGEDANGELYAVRQTFGTVSKIVRTACDVAEDCDDGLFCNGAEDCVDNECVIGAAPCPGQLCRESDDQCVNCLNSGDCEDGQLCTVDTCDAAGDCAFPPVECPAGEACDPVTGQCIANCESDNDCPSEERCDTETGLCVDCLSDMDCPLGRVCRPETGTCVQCLNDGDCNFGLHCTPQFACRECVVDSHCDDGLLCTDDACQSYNCVFLSIFCPIPTQCDPADGVCKECLADEDCENGEFCDLSTHLCSSACQSDENCPDGQHCNVEKQICLDCLNDTHCADDGLFCNGPAICVNNVCAQGAPPCLEGECDEDSDACVPTGDAVHGGRLYDNWAAELGVTPPQTDHPLWALRPDPTSNPTTGAATWRCTECHGWDYKGVDGQYGAGSHRTGFRGVLNSSLSPFELISLLSEVPSNGEHRGEGVENGHGYGGVLSESDINDLMAFVLTGGVIEQDAFIDPKSGEIDGDSVVGEMNFVIGGCITCHGTDGTAINFGTSDAPEFIGTVAVENPWELFHKIRHGQPGTSMPSWILGGGTIEGVAAIGRFAQDNFPVDCTTDDHCGGGDLCSIATCADGRCTFLPRLYGDTNNDGLIDISDIFCVLDAFQSMFENCTFADADIGNCTPDELIDISDIFAVIDAFQGDDPCCEP